MWYVLAALAVLIAVVLIRTFRFRAVEEERPAPDPMEFDSERAVDHLRRLVMCRTVSYEDHSLEDESEFEKLRSMLPEMYPNVFRVCEFERVGRTGLLFRWKGRSDAAPSVLMAHYDVVPVDERGWDKPAFDGIIENGELWGRGTLDTKITFCSSLEAAETLIAKGFTPENDLYFSYAGDEETFGHGASDIVDLLEQRGIKPQLVVDEGGAVVENVFPGVSDKCAMVGIAEKGMIVADFTMKGNGGHASAPLPHGPVGYLAKAVWDVETHPFPVKLCSPVAQMYDTLGRRSSFLYRMIFSNLWLFLPVLDMICKKSGGELNALMRTTCAFTQMEGSAANNVIPPQASVGANLRLIGGDTVEGALAYLRKVVNNPGIEITARSSQEPSITSDTDSDAWRKVKKAIEQTWTDAIVSPYIMVQCSDSRHFNRISDKVMRFSAMELTKEERGRIHGNNERIPLDKIGKAVEFYLNLERQC